MDNEINEKFKSIENRVNAQDTRIDRLDSKLDKLDEKQDKDHTELVSIKKDTQYIKEMLKEVKEKWDDWDKENLNQKEKIKWTIIGIGTTLFGGLMLKIIAHFMCI